MSGHVPTLAWTESVANSDALHDSSALHKQGSQGRINASSSHANAGYVRGRLDYDELEDKYLKLREENHGLKTKLMEQEDRIKTLHAKYMKLTDDLRRKDAEVSLPASRHKRDIEVDRFVEELTDKVRVLTKRNEQLEMKNSQLSEMVGSKSSTRSLSASKRPQSASSKRPPVSHQDAPVMSSAADSKKDEVEKENLVQLVEMLRKQLSQADSAIQDLKAENKALKSTSKTTTDQLVILQSQRELREKQAQLNLMQNKYDHLDNTQTALKENHIQVLAQLEETARNLTNERRRAIQLETQLKIAQMQADRSRELEMMCDSLRSEKSIVEQENRKLVEAAFSEDGIMNASRRKQQDKAIQEALDRATAEAKAAQEDKASLTSQLQALQIRYDELQRESLLSVSERRKKEEQIQQITEELNKVKAEFNLLATQSGLDVQDLQEVFALLRKRREQSSSKRLVDMLRAELALQNVDEIDVAAQNADLAAEVSSLQKHVAFLKQSHVQLEEAKDQLQRHLNQQLAVAEEKNSRAEQTITMLKEQIKHLEEELQKLESDQRHAQYWRTRSFTGSAQTLQSRDVPLSATYAFAAGETAAAALTGVHAEYQNLLQEDDDFPPANLADDENALEFTIVGASLDSSAVSDPSITTFCCLEFLDFETVVTPIEGGMCPAYDFSARFSFKQDAFFWKYVSSHSVRIIVYRARGFEQADMVFGICTIPAADIFAVPALARPRSLMSVIFSASSASGTSVEVGRLEITVRSAKQVQVPLSVQTSNATGGKAGAIQSFVHSSLSNVVTVGYVQIHIIQCTGLCRAARVYAAYEFYTFRPRETAAARLPQTMARFDDIQLYPVQMDRALEAYLVNEKLRIFLIDENSVDPNPGAALVGSVALSLQMIKSKQSFEGKVEIDTGGFLEVRIAWKDHAGRDAPHSAIEQHGSLQALEDDAVVVSAQTRENSGRPPHPVSQQDEKSASASVPPSRMNPIITSPRTDSFNPMTTPTPTPIKPSNMSISHSAANTPRRPSDGHTNSSSSGPEVPKVQWSTPRGAPGTPSAPLEPSYTPRGDAPGSARRVIQMPSTPAPVDTPSADVEQSDNDVTRLVEELHTEAPFDRHKNVLVAVSDVHIEPTLLSKDGLSSVYVRVADRSSNFETIFALPSSVSTSKSVAVESNGRARVSLSAVFAMEPGSKSRFRVSRMLKDQDEDNADIVFTVFSANDGRVLGQCELNMQHVENSGKDILKDEIPVIDLSGISVGYLVVSFVAVKFLQQVRREMSP
eukprot:ANDGO_06113.mRNA.1 hypothetical protein